MADIEAYSTVIQGLREQSRECKVSSTNNIWVQILKFVIKSDTSTLTFRSAKYTSYGFVHPFQLSPIFPFDSS